MTAQSLRSGFFLRPSLLRYGLITLLLLIVLLVLVRVSLPFIIHNLTVSWLKQHNVSASIDNINLNFFAGDFILHGLHTESTAGQQLTIKQAVFSWRWLPLLDRSLTIDRIAINGVQLGIAAYHDGSINLGGLGFPLAVTDAKDASSDQTHSANFSFSLAELQLDNIEICLQQFDADKKASSDRCLQLAALSWKGAADYSLPADDPPDDMALSIHGTVKLGRSEILDQLQHKTVLSFDSLSLDALALTSLSEINSGALVVDTLVIEHVLTSAAEQQFFAVEASSISIDSLSLIDLELAGLNTLQIENMQFRYRELREQQAVVDYTARLSQFLWQGDLGYSLAQTTETKAAPLSADASLSLHQLTLRNLLLQRTLLQLQTATLHHLVIDTLDSVTVKSLSLNFAQALQLADDTGEPSYTAAFDSLNVDSISFSTLNRLAISNLALKQLAVQLIRNTSGKMAYTEWLPAETNRNNDSAADSTAFHYALKNIRLDTSRPLSYVDHSLQQRFSASLHDTQLALDQLNTQQAEHLSHLKFSATYDKSTTVELDTKISPLAKRPHMNGSARITDLDLRSFSPLTQDQLGHSIRSGQLDADITLLAKNAVLDSSIELTLNHFELRASSQQDAAALEQSLGLPLNSSLALLRDDENQIRLTIPITGDINKPNFSPRDAIKQATTRAITTTALLYYTPYGAMLVADKLFTLATALRLEPLVYAAGESDLTTKHKEQLDLIAQMLKQRPAVNLTLCGIANKADLLAWYSDAATVTQAQQQSLEDLAEQRGQKAKDYLVTDIAINPSRLALCAPELQLDTNTPRLEISI